jgi:hypothetical protein
MSDTLCSRIIAEVADETGSDPASLPPLYEAIDPEALEALYDHSSGERAERRRDPTVQFRYAGRVVVVWSATDIDVNEPVTDPLDERA